MNLAWRAHGVLATVDKAFQGPVEMEVVAAGRATIQVIVDL